MTSSTQKIKKLWSLFMTRAFIFLLAISFFFLTSCQTTQLSEFETQSYITQYVSYAEGQPIALPFSKPIMGGYSGNVEALHELGETTKKDGSDIVLSKSLLRNNLNYLVGENEDVLNNWLGVPSMKRRDADIRIYQYHTSLCIADIFAQKTDDHIIVKDIILRFPRIVQGRLDKREATEQEKRSCVSSLLKKRAKSINI